MSGAHMKNRPYQFMLLILILFSSICYSQTVIKEKVSITAEKLNTQKKDSLLQIKGKKNKIEYKVTGGEEYTTKIIMPFEGHAIVTIIGSEAAGSHTLILRSPIEMEIVDKPEVKIGYRWKSPRFREGDTLDFGLWFKGVEGVPAGWEGGAIRYETGLNTYEFWYDNSIFDGDYDDIVIEVRICSNEKWVGVNIRDTIKVIPTETITIRAWIEICDIEEIEGIKYRAEIVKGKEYGEIEDVNSGVRGDLLEEIIPEWNNEIEFMLNFENIEITEEKIIEIKISATDEGVIPAFIVVKLIPSSIIVIMEPEEIKPGEEANIILKKRNRDGTITEFREEQLFDIRIKEGEEYGTIWIEDWGDTTDEAYFIRAAGLKFKAREDIEKNEVEVIIEVRTSPEIIAGNIKEGQKEKNRVILRKDSNIKDETEDDENEPLWGIGKVIIKRNDCSSAPQCEGEVEPKINIIKIEESHCNDNPIADGITIFYIKRFEDEFDLSACYNNQLDKWQFEIITPLKYSSEVCYREGRVYLRDTSDLRRLSIDELCNAEVDIANFENAQHTIYKVEEIIRKHEEIHVEQNINMFNQALQKIKFYEKFKLLTLRCGDFDSLQKALEYADKYFKLNLVKKLKQEYLKIKNKTEGNPYSEEIEKINQWIKNEENINRKLYSVRDEYLEAIKKIAKCL